MLHVLEAGGRFLLQYGDWVVLVLYMVGVVYLTKRAYRRWAKEDMQDAFIATRSRDPNIIRKQSWYIAARKRKTRVLWWAGHVFFFPVMLFWQLLKWAAWGLALPVMWIMDHEREKALVDASMSSGKMKCGRCGEAVEPRAKHICRPDLDRPGGGRTMTCNRCGQLVGVTDKHICSNRPVEDRAREALDRMEDGDGNACVDCDCNPCECPF